MSSVAPVLAGLQKEKQKCCRCILYTAEGKPDGRSGALEAGQAWAPSYLFLLMALDVLSEVLIIKKLENELFMMVLKTDFGNSRVSPQILMSLKHLWSFLLFSIGSHRFLLFLEVLKLNQPLSSAYSISYSYFFQHLSGHPGFVKEIFSCEEHKIKTSQLWLYINRIIALRICTVLGNFLMAALAFWLKN